MSPFTPEIYFENSLLMLSYELMSNGLKGYEDTGLHHLILAPR
jgi:hypothetical protein